MGVEPRIGWAAVLPVMLGSACGCGGQGTTGIFTDPGSGSASSGSSGGSPSSSGAGSGSGGASGASSSGGGSGSGGSGGNSASSGSGASSGGGGGSGSGSSGGSGGSSGSASSSGASGGSSGGTGTGCGAGDPNLPPEPTIPPACTTLQANQAVGTGLPSETNLDTTRIQAALNACASGQAVKLTTNGANNGFITGPLTLPAGVTLWIDAGTTLYASRTQTLYGATCGTAGVSCTPLILARGANSGIVGDGAIDGQGGEPVSGQSQSWWDLTASTGGTVDNPALVRAASGATNFKLYRISLHNSPKIHVKLDPPGFVVWGVTVKTPSKATNSQGTALSAVNAVNTDGIDPGGPASNGYIVCSRISDGDDQIAIKGSTAVHDLTIAHNHFGAGHGMSIGSETNGGVSNINVYDLSIDGTGSGMGGGSSNGIRIKSDASRGGAVTNVTYSDVCVRGLANPIILSPRYSSATGTLIPDYTGITIRNFRSVGTSVAPVVSLLGYDAAHVTTVTLDNVVVDGISASSVKATYANVTLGPGSVNFTPSGTGVTVNNSVSGAPQANGCTGKWVVF